MQRLSIIIIVGVVVVVTVNALPNVRQTLCIHEYI